MQRTNSHSSAGSGSTGFSSQFSGNSERGWGAAAACRQARAGPATLRLGSHSPLPSVLLFAGANSQGSQPAEAGGGGGEDVAAELAGNSLQGSLQVSGGQAGLPLPGLGCAG